MKLRYETLVRGKPAVIVLSTTRKGLVDLAVRLSDDERCTLFAVLLQRGDQLRVPDWQTVWTRPSVGEPLEYTPMALDRLEKLELMFSGRVYSMHERIAAGATFVTEVEEGPRGILL